ncbi:MAG: hypothetical protein ACHQC8_01830 [Solirubrobacterales bacterium]
MSAKVAASKRQDGRGDLGGAAAGDGERVLEQLRSGTGGCIGGAGDLCQERRGLGSTVAAAKLPALGYSQFGRSTRERVEPKHATVVQKQPSDRLRRLQQTTLT